MGERRKAGDAGDGQRRFDEMMRRAADQPLGRLRDQIIPETTAIRKAVEELEKTVGALDDHVETTLSGVPDDLRAAAARDAQLLALTRRIAEQFEPANTGGLHRRDGSAPNLDQRLTELAADHESLRAAVAELTAAVTTATRRQARRLWLLTVLIVVLVAAMGLLTAVALST